MSEIGGQVKWIIDGDDSGLERTLRGAGNKVDDFSRNAQDANRRAGASFSQIAQGALAFVGVISVFDTLQTTLGGAIASFGDFESNIGVLRAVTQATTPDLEKLRTTAIALGNDITLPGISASDAAVAMTELGKAGLGVNDILSASRGVLQAAKAGNIGVADSAKIVSNALLAFNLQGTEATRIADLFAGAANASNAEILDLGLGLQQASASANSLSVPIDDTVAALAGLANAGIRASDAGTSIKTFFASLTPSSRPAIDAINKLGISFFDAQGNFVGLRQAISLLENSTKGLTQEQKQQTIETIFGSDASRAAIVLANQGVASFDKLKGAITRQGAAAELAAARNSGIKGSLEALKSATETALLGFGEFLSKGLKPIIDAAAGNLPQALSLVGGAIVGIGIAAAGGIAPVLGFAASIGAAVLTAAPFIAAGIAIAGTLFFLQDKFNIFGKIADFIGPIFNNIVSTIKDAIGKIIPILQPVIDFVGGTFKDIFEDLGGIFRQLGETLKPVFDAIGKVFNDNKEIIMTVLKAIGIAAAALTFGPLIAAIGIVIGAIKLLSIVLGFINDNFDTIKNVILAIIGVALTPLMVTINVIVGLFRFWLSVAQATIAGMVAVFKVLIAIFSTVFNIVSSVIGVIVNIITTLARIWFAVWSGIGEIVFTVLSTIAQIVAVILTALASFIFNSFIKPVIDTFLNGFDTVLKIVTDVFNNVRDFLVGVMTTISNTLSPIVQGIVDFFTEKFNNLRNNVVGVFNGVRDFLSGVWTNIRNTLAPIIEGIVGFFSEKFNNIRSNVTEAFNFVRNKVNDFVNAGRDIINGLTRGVEGGRDAVVNKIKDICNSALDSVKKFFGIKSPSTVMAKQGQFIMAGLEKGLDSGISGVLGATDRASKAILNGFDTPSLGLVGGGSAGTYVPPGASMGGAMGSNMQVTQNIYSQVDYNRGLQELNWRLRSNA